jgi:hypothetical protein
MADEKNGEPVLWYRASARNVVLFAIMFWWPLLPIVFFLRRLHVSLAIIWFLVAYWVLVGLMMLIRPNWLARWIRWLRREQERTGERLEKLPPRCVP